MSIRGDQRTNIGIAGGYHAVEWGHDLLKGLELFEPCDVRLVRLNGCLVRFQSAGCIVSVLCRDRTTPQQILVAPGRDGRELEIGVGGSKVGAGLAQLLVDFGRVDLGQQVADP
jgi:hypothetical protein